MNRSPLNPMSAKRRAQLAAAGVVRPFSTLTPAGRDREPRTAPHGKRPADTGPDAATVAAVRERDGFQCVRCGGACHGQRGRDWSIQHRRARGMGGTKRPDTNQPQDLILVCGSATTACHGHIESFRDDAEANGWAVKSNVDPLTAPVVHSLHGVVWLLADGGWSSRRPNACEVT